MLGASSPVRNARLTQFDRKKPGLREFSCSRWRICDSPDVYLARESVGLLSKLFLAGDTVHVHETVTVTEQVRDEAGVQSLADATGAPRDEGARVADASQRRACRSELALQGGRIIKEGGAEELQHPVFVSGHDRVAGGVWCGEVHVVVRVRHHGTDASLDLIDQPAPIGGGETRLPDRWSVAPFKEVPDETLPAQVVLHVAGAFDDGLHDLHSPRGPWTCPSSAPSRVAPWRWRTHGGARTTARPLRSSSTPRGTSRSTEETFQRHHLRFGTPYEKTPFEGPPGEPMAGKEHTTVAPYVQAPFEGPEDVHLLDRRVIRSSQVLHSEDAR